MDVETTEAIQMGELEGHNEKDNPADAQQEHDQTKPATTNAQGSIWDEAFLVQFAPGDAENPLNWSIKLKWGDTVAVSGTGSVRIVVSTV
ncbi:unnamed protein product [Discula destructiva]